MDVSASTARWQRHTILAVVVLTALAFWTAAPDAFGLPKATILWVGTIAIVALGAARVVWERMMRIPQSAWAAAACAFLVAVGLATLLSPWPALSAVGAYERYTGLVSYACFVIIGLTVLRLFDVDEAVLVLRAMAGVLAVAAVYGMLQLAGLDPLDLRAGVTAIPGTMGNANIFAGLLAVTIPAAAWAALSETTSPPWRWGAAAAALGGFVVAVGTQSFQGPVAALPGLVLVVAVWSTTGDGRARMRALAGRIGFSRRGAIAVGVAAAVVALGMFATALPSGLRSGFLERGDFWRAAMSMFGDRPIFGVGFDGYQQQFLAVRPVGHALRLGGIHAESAHSVPLNLLAGGGLVVAVSWIAMVVLTGRALVIGLRRLDGEERLLLGGLGGAWVAYLVQATVSFDVPTLGALHLVLTGVIVAIGTPPRWREWRLPGQPARPASGRRRSSVPTGTSVAFAAIAVIAVAAMWSALGPLRADLAAARAQQRIEAGDPAGAAASLERATSLAPWRGFYWALRAQLAEASAEVFAAIDYAGEAAAREPGNSQYALLAGRLNLRYRSAADARPWFDAALARDPHNPYVLAEVARYEAEAGDLVRARELVDEALQGTDDPLPVQLALAVVERAAGNENAARAAYEAALAVAPGFPEAVQGLRELDGETAGGAG